MEQAENARERPSDAVQDEILASVLQKIGGFGSSVDTSASAKDGVSSSDGANPVGDIISSILSNPDMLSKLPSLISSVKPIIEMLGKGSRGGTSQAMADGSTIPTSTSYKPSSSATQESAHDQRTPSSKSDSRTALLCAMKPYLSEDRRNAVDYIVKLSRLGEILKTL